jgi:hypothetical protein
MKNQLPHTGILFLCFESVRDRIPHYTAPLTKRFPEAR